MYKLVELRIFSVVNQNLQEALMQMPEGEALVYQANYLGGLVDSK